MATWAGGAAFTEGTLVGGVVGGVAARVRASPQTAAPLHLRRQHPHRPPALPPERKRGLRWHPHHRDPTGSKHIVSMGPIKCAELQNPYQLMSAREQYQPARQDPLAGRRVAWGWGTHPPTHPRNTMRQLHINKYVMFD